MTAQSPIGSIAKGVVAGAVGTLAMDLVWYRRYRQGDGTDSFSKWELSGATSFEEASAPGKVGQLVASKLGVEIPERLAGVTTNVVHWATGIGWGSFGAAASAVIGAPGPAVGLATGVTAWATSYATLAPLGIYEPIWKYDVATLWKDLSAHLVFGIATGMTLTVLGRCRST